MQYVAVFITKYNLSITSFVPNFRILSQVVSQKFLTEKKDHWREKKEQIKGLISNMWLFLQHNATYHYQALYQISISFYLTVVVSEDGRQILG